MYRSVELWRMKSWFLSINGSFPVEDFPANHGILQGKHNLVNSRDYDMIYL